MNPKLDLVFERTTHLTPETIWKGWTQPETLMQWFCPRPWKVTDCKIELKPGGAFYTLMEGPNGERSPSEGCFLEIIENKKLVWTNLMSGGFLPNNTQQLGFAFVITLTLTKTETGTHYKAVVAHADEAGRKQHDEMGFQHGWGLAFDQLVELMK